MATKDDILRLRLEVESKDAQRQLDQFETKTKTTATKTSAATKKMAAGFSDVRAQMLKASVAIGAVVAAGVALDRFFDRAQQISNLSRGFETLTRRAGESADVFLNEMRRGARGFVSDVELMKQGNAALLLGLDVTAEQMGDLTDGAIKLGRAMGLDATRSIESLITGIGRQSRPMLDNLGIIVSAEEAQKKYAAAIGTTVAKLTDAQRKDAFTSEAIRKVTESAKGLGEGLDTLADKWDRVTVSASNATNAMIEFVNAPSNAGFTELFPGLSTQLEAARQLLSAGGGLDQLIVSATGIGADQVNPVTSRQDMARTFRNQAGMDEAAQIAAAKAEQDRLNAALNTYNETMADIALRYADVEERVTRNLETQRASTAELERFLAITEQFGPSDEVSSAFGAPEDTSGFLINVVNPEDLVNVGLMAEGLPDLSGAIDVAADAYWGLTDAAHSATGAMIDQAIAGNLSAKGMVQAMADAVSQSLKILAQEYIVKAAGQVAEGFGALARYDYPAATAHFTSAAKFVGAAGLAGVGASIAGRQGSPGSAGGSRASGGFGVESPAITPSAAAPQHVQEVHVFLEGHGVITNIDEFTRDLSEKLLEQRSRAGA